MPEWILRRAELLIKGFRAVSRMLRPARRGKP
jgi:hypothetical protein